MSANLTNLTNWEELVSAAMIAREDKDNSQWELGDIALQVSTVYGKDSLGKFASEIGVARSTLYQYRKVSKIFPSNMRVERLSHRHHCKATASIDPYTMLDRADKNNWTSEQLALMIKEEPKVVECPSCKTAFEIRQ